MKIAVEMFDKLHFAIDRKPVCMNVGNAHEDTNHQASVVKVGIFVNLFNNNNLPICRSDNYSIGIFNVKIAYRTLIKVYDDAINKAINHDEKPKGPFCFK